jgi:hypothetical protein
MSCIEKSKSLEEKCPPELAEKTAEEVCKEVEEKADTVYQSVQKAIDSVNPFKIQADLIKSIADTVSSKSVSDLSIINNVANNLRSTNIMDQLNKCENNTNISQSNVINGMTESCTMSLLNSNLSADDIAKFSSINGVDQSNKSESVQSCKINSMSNALSELDVSTDNQAVQKVLNDSEGLLSESNSKGRMCNNISTNTSACKYLTQKQCCTNNINVVQSNSINKNCSIGTWSNIRQANDNKSNSSCALSAESDISDTMSSTIVNKIGQDSTNKSSGITMSFLLIIFMIILLVVGAPVIMAASLPSSLFYVLGFLLFVGGCICVVLYFVNSKKEIKKVNKPLFMCKNSEVYKNANYTRSTFLQTKTIYRQNVDIVGFDFISDDKKTILVDDNQLGTVLYFSYVEDDEECEDPKDDVITHSYIKGPKDIKYLISGGLLLISGIILLLIGMFKKSDVSTKDVTE